MLCVTIGRGRHQHMIAEYQHLADLGADIVELRLDYLRRHIDLHRLLANRPCPVIITCRRREDGGRWEKSESERLTILRAAIASGVDYVDLEEDIAAAIPRYGSTKRIVSLHNFEFTPENLEEIQLRLATLDADIVKIATLANSFTDCIRMLRLVDSSTVPTIGLCMGEMGMITRILALRYGAPFTYTTLTTERKIAPGQITFDMMRNVYRGHEINDSTKFFGVVADPVAHSMSPLIHNRAFQHHGLNYSYLPFRITAEELPLFVQWCREFGIGGLSVTIPHKEAMLQLVDEAESAARNIGALNTVAFTGGNAAGFNTDYRAAMDCLTAAVTAQDPDNDDPFRGRGALILGAGGVARAIAYGLRQRGALVAISSRTLERAENLARQVGGRALPWNARYDIRPGIIVNCSPIGMHPNIDSSPYDKDRLVNPATIVFDTVYNPEQTLLVKEARAAGCFVINGLDMFVRQAAYQYKLFTGIEAPTDLMRETVKKITSPVNF
ncbi:MAG: shikimate dehydrogenase [Planctomycetales bacterium]|nr:shikimate dehydrogenase [Planctomycetales bacterium]